MQLTWNFEKRKVVMKISKITKKILLGIIKFYRKYLSGLKRAPSCKYYPTCSEYAIEAIEKHGPLKGLGLAVKRFLRCNPFSKGGYDPVP